MDRAEFRAKIQGEGEESTRSKIVQGLYRPKREKWAQEWLDELAEARSHVITKEESRQEKKAEQPINVFFIVTNKIKPIKWLLKKLGVSIGDAKQIEHGTN
jgi:chromatin segregation and condensation protein Rec8/ScpA/Scc1 (kleisin family)